MKTIGLNPLGKLICAQSKCKESGEIDRTGCSVSSGSRYKLLTLMWCLWSEEAVSVVQLSTSEQT